MGATFISLSFQIFEARHERHGMVRRLDEAPMLIEVLGVLGERMHQDARYAGVLGEPAGSCNGVAEQCGAKAFALLAAVNGEAAENHHWNWVGHIPAQATGRFVRRDGAGGKSIIAHNLRAAGRHEGARRAAGLVAQRTATQPVIKGGLAALELVEEVAFA